MTGPRVRCLLVLALALGPPLASQDSPVMDEAVKPLYFETLIYPLKARLLHQQGVVVVRVRLNDHGEVISSVALTGAKVLIPECLSNARKWRFQPNPEKTAIIVYQFKIEGLCNLPCASHFTFLPPNFATITTGDPVIDHPGK